MEYIYDAPFSDVFVCDGDVDFHDYYYISPYQTDESSYLYYVHRTGIERMIPKLFRVERTEATQYCEIFCILSGRGFLEYRGKTYQLKRNQLVVLTAHEPHKYYSDPDDPMGKVWLEFYGADAGRITRHIIDQQSPIIEGSIFSDVCAAICLIQQRLMINKYYQPSLEVYRVLLSFLKTSEIAYPLELSEDNNTNFLLVEAYINAHMSEKITNEQLAAVCGVSVQYFIRLFREHYHVTPQEYIMKWRIKKAKFALTQTGLSVDSIAESLGFCNASHFIRRFSEETGKTPMVFRKASQHTAGGQE
jgi:AraC-like DNA-binding protein